MKIAFTGRADELTKAQRVTIHAMLKGYPVISVGTNRGKSTSEHRLSADEWMMELCESERFETWETDPTLRPMQRNRQLASRCDVLIGAPPTEYVLKRGSGTWETIKYGWKYGKDVFVVTPSGKVYNDRPSVPKNQAEARRESVVCARTAVIGLIEDILPAGSTYELANLTHDEIELYEALSRVEKELDFALEEKSGR